MPSAREEAMKASACFLCLKPSCYRKFKDKSISDEDQSKRKALCKLNSYKSKAGWPKIAETKTEETKPSEDKKVVTEIQSTTEATKIENPMKYIHQTRFTSTPLMYNNVIGIIKEEPVATNDIKIEPFEDDEENATTEIKVEANKLNEIKSKNVDKIILHIKNQSNKPTAISIIVGNMTDI